MNRTFISTVLTLSVFSYIGEALRNFLEKLFGSACDNPGTIDWDEPTNWAPCLTTDGDKVIEDTNGFTGGALFTDLPVNMIGCFIMGFFVVGDESLGLPVDMNIAFLPRKNFFQKWSIWHLGIRTGFCGCLTTFASWNTQMVTMLIGGSEATAVGSSQWFTVIFGYMIGLALSLASYQVGIHAAIASHRRFNKDLAKEADILYERIGADLNVYNKHKKLVHRDLPDFERNFLTSVNRFSMIQRPRSSRGRESIHRDLPNSERRFLHDIDDDDGAEGENIADIIEQQQLPQNNHQSVTENCELDASASDREDGNNTQSGNAATLSTFLPGSTDKEAFLHLQKWKESTDKHRKGLVDNGGTFQSELQEIERAILIDNKEPREELLNTARDLGWDVDALRDWKRNRNEDYGDNPEDNPDSDTKESILADCELMISFCLFIILTALLLWWAIVADYDSATKKTRKTTVISALIAPLGTLLRWRLSKLNGYSTNPKWTWVPFGTLAANLIGSVVSALVVGIELRTDDHLTEIWMGALKTGFAGCLSTVSTYAAETTKLMELLPRHSYGYYYSIGSLVLGCIVGVLSYFWAVL